MNIIVNGTPTRLEKGKLIMDLIQQLELNGKRLAVEVNCEIIPKSEHASYQLNEGDKIEIVHAIGGG